MGQIKSALEIALERTESVKGDKASINHFEAKQRGKKLANEFLVSGGAQGKEVNLGEALKKPPKKKRKISGRGSSMSWSPRLAFRFPRKT